MIDAENQELEEKTQHEKGGWRWHYDMLYPYGKKQTFITITLSLVALIASFLAKRSISFVALHKSLAPPDIIYTPTYNLGLYRIQLCTGTGYNISAVYGDKSLSSINLFDDSTHVDGIYRRDLQQIDDIFFRNESDCKIVRLNAAEVGDRFWNLARLSGAVAVFFGVVMTSWIIVSFYSSKVNIRAVGILGLTAYLFESLTFILFASRLCDNLGCSLSSGGYYCMIATMFWFAASLGAINMYYYHRESVLLDLTLQTNFEAPTEPPLTE